MSLDRVTFTGADDSIDPIELVRLSAEFPFVEWGILFSYKRQGSPRYPTYDWLRRLSDVVEPGTKLSAHLCGRWARDLVLMADTAWFHEDLHCQYLFERIQLNINSRVHGSDDGFKYVSDMYDEKQFILQCGGVNEEFPNDMARLGLAVPLFDASGGAGRLPGEWPHAWPGVYCGYAGGLGPENIREQLVAIADAAGAERFWIDMERRVRSEDDHRFDLAKVRSVLEQIKDEVTSA